MKIKLARLQCLLYHAFAERCLRKNAHFIVKICVPLVLFVKRPLDHLEGLLSCIRDVLLARICQGNLPRTYVAWNYSHRGDNLSLLLIVHLGLSRSGCVALCRSSVPSEIQNQVLFSTNSPLLRLQQRIVEHNPTGRRDISF